MTADRKAGRRAPFEAAFKGAGISRRQAIIAAIRKWTREHAKTTETTGETQ